MAFRSCGSTIPTSYFRLGNADEKANAARAYIVDAVGTLSESVCCDFFDPSIAVAPARPAIARAMHEAVRSVDLVCQAAGTKRNLLCSDSVAMSSSISPVRILATRIAFATVSAGLF